MKIACLFGHRWDGCQCLRCKKGRDTGHSWEGCKCTACGAQRDESHNWNACSCRRCYARRPLGDASHKWAYGVCDTCGLACPPASIQKEWQFAGEISQPGYGYLEIVGTCIDLVSDQEIIARVYSEATDGEKGPLLIKNIWRIIPAKEFTAKRHSLRRR
jgi:hypothetical protein